MDSAIRVFLAQNKEIKEGSRVPAKEPKTRLDPPTLWIECEEVRGLPGHARNKLFKTG